MQRLGLIFLTLILCTSLFAQHQQCGLSEASRQYMSQRLHDRVQHYLEQGGVPSRTNTTIYIPITFHMVSNEDSLGTPNPIEIMRTLCLINEAYEPSTLQFYVKRFNYIYNDDVYTAPGSNAAENVMEDEKVDDSVNMFICNTADTGGEPDGGVTLGYFSPWRDWLVVRKQNFIPINFATPTHELGHFFSLMHTFNGWECGSFCGPGNAPNMSTCGELTEKASGSNCNNAGDFVCDTKPDYNFGYDCANGCPNSFCPEAKDQTGATLSCFTGPYNFMSYFLGCNTYEFSNQQMDLMVDDADSPQRNYLMSNYVPTTPAVSTAATLISPENIVTLPYNSIDFSWEAIPNATSYLLEIDKSTSFNILPKRYTSTTNSITVTNLLPNQNNLRWRVWGFNETGICGTTASAVRTFSTSSSTSNTAELTARFGLEISPNPSKPNAGFKLEIESLVAFEAQLTLLSSTGQSVLEKSTKFNVGSNVYDIDTQNLPVGYYVLAINTPQGIIRKPVIISE